MIKRSKAHHCMFNQNNTNAIYTLEQNIIYQKIICLTITVGLTLLGTRAKNFTIFANLAKASI